MSAEGRAAMHRVDVWLVQLAALDAPSLERWFAWLMPDEKLKHGRFATRDLQREYLVTRALSRWALSRYVPTVGPAEWRFERTEAGRPFVVAPCEAPHFNLSNADGLVVCAVSEQYRVGVDVEPVTRGDDLLANAHRLFSDRENAELSALPHALRSEYAVASWTVKEAYLKARGEGIAVRMNRFTVHAQAPLTDPPKYPRRFCLVGDGLDEAPDGWQFEVVTIRGSDRAGESSDGRTDRTGVLPSGHMLAVAIQRGRAPDVNVSYAEGLGSPPA